ncbi:hypothetical protein P7C73_g5174, partial [Tremellales sp. Uapishka_1]
EEGEEGEDVGGTGGKEGPGKKGGSHDSGDEDGEARSANDESDSSSISSDSTPRDLTPTPSPSPSPSPSPPQPVPARRPTRGEAFDYLRSWLVPLFTPLAHWALEVVKQDAIRVENQPISPQQALAQALAEEDAKYNGARAMLHAHLIHKMGGRLPSYVETKVGTIWTVECCVREPGEKGREWRASAARPTKKIAGQVAAYSICLQMGLNV